MKTKKALYTLHSTLYTCVLALALAACADDATTTQQTYSEIVLKSAICNGSITRTIAQDLQEYSFEAGQQVGVFVEGAATPTDYTGYDNVKLTTTSDNGFTGETMSYPKTGEVNITCYAPYDENVGLYNTMEFSVLTDQSTDEAYINSDLLYANTTASNCYESVTVKFYHMLTKLDITFSGYTEALLGEDVYVSGNKITTTFNIGNAELGEATGSATDVLACRYDEDADTYTCSVIVVPQTTSEMSVHFGEYVFTLPGTITFESGTRYSFNGTITRDMVAGELELDTTIKGWKDAGDDSYDSEEDSAGAEGDYEFDLLYINPSIYGTGDYDWDTWTLVTDSFGYGGWEFEEGLDLSNYKYLVFEFAKGTNLTSGSQIRIYDEYNYWGTPAGFSINSYQVVIDMDNQVMAESAQAAFDPSHVYMVGFWTWGGSANAVVINRVYATNDEPEAAESTENNMDGTIDYEFDLADIDATIWGDGTYNSITNKLVTGAYGFGGWQFSAGLDLSNYQYLVIELLEGTNYGEEAGALQWRMFDENSYWVSCAGFVIETETTIIDLTNQKAQFFTAGGDSFVEVDPSHIYLAGFWCYGGTNYPIYIDRIYATNNPPTIEAEEEVEDETDGEETMEVTED